PARARRADDRAVQLPCADSCSNDADTSASALVDDVLQAPDVYRGHQLQCPCRKPDGLDVVGLRVVDGALPGSRIAVALLEVVDVDLRHSASEGIEEAILAQSAGLGQLLQIGDSLRERANTEVNGLLEVVLSNRIEDLAVLVERHDGGDVGEVKVG